MKKYKAIYDVHREIIIHAETREEANEEAVRRRPRGFDYADLQELEETEEKKGGVTRLAEIETRFENAQEKNIYLVAEDPEAWAFVKNASLDIRHLLDRVKVLELTCRRLEAIRHAAEDLLKLPERTAILSDRSYYIQVRQDDLNRLLAVTEAFSKAKDDDDTD